MTESFANWLFVVGLVALVGVLLWDLWIEKGKRFLRRLLVHGLIDSISTVEKTLWTDGKRIVIREVHIRKSGRFEIDYVSQSGEGATWYFLGSHDEAAVQEVEERLHRYKPWQLIAFAKLLVRGRGVFSTIETDAGRGWNSKTMDIRFARQ